MPKLVNRPLTELAIKKAAKATARYDIFDASVRGLGVRIAPSGTKSWFIMRRFNGKMLRTTFGRYPEVGLADARLRVPEVLLKMSKGNSSQGNDTFETIVAEWIKRDQSKNKSVEQVKTAIKRHVSPVFSGRKLDKIKKQDIIKLIDQITDGGSPVAANRILAFLKRFFNWCVERDILEVSPALSIKANTGEISRDRVLDVGELLSLWTIEGKLNYPWGAILKLLMLTGARLKEVSEVTWDEISLEEQIWSIPSSRTKNSRPHQIHLSTQAIQILRSLPSVKDQSFLFSTNGVRPVSGFSKAKKRIDLLSGVDNWRFHDLRRSFATHTTEKLEVPPVIIDKILNHVSGAVKGVAAIYQRGEYLEQRREALQAWGDYLEDLGKCH